MSETSWEAKTCDDQKRYLVWKYKNNLYFLFVDESIQKWSKLSFVNYRSLLCGETKHKEGTYFISKYELFLPTNLIQIWKDYQLKAACLSCFMHFPITYNFLHEVWNLFLTNVIVMIYSPRSNLFMLIKQICTIWVKFNDLHHEFHYKILVLKDVIIFQSNLLW